VREFDTVARLGGDEFAILLAHLDDPVEGARKFANRVLDVFETPFELGKHTVRVGTSIGIALAPRDGANIDTLMANADYALYRAKAQGRNSFRFFDSKEDTPGKVIEAKLRTA
jgi:diguanylate cyclase (GGDEF)-like protein